MESKSRLKFQQFYNHLTGFGEAPIGFTPAGRLSIHEAFAVYQNGYLARLTDALGDTYETIWKFLGDEDFFSLARQYIQFHPSFNYNINNYGVNFGNFLATHSAAKSNPCLVDLAKLDWLRSLLFHQATEIGLEKEDLLAGLNEEACLSLVSSFIFFESQYSLHQLWSDIHKDHWTDDNLAASETVCLFKRGNQVFVYSLPASCYQPLNKLMHGNSIEKALIDLDETSAQSLFHFVTENRLVRSLG